MNLTLAFLTSVSQRQSHVSKDIQITAAENPQHHLLPQVTLTCCPQSPHPRMLSLQTVPWQCSPPCCPPAPACVTSPIRHRSTPKTLASTLHLSPHITKMPQDKALFITPHPKPRTAPGSGGSQQIFGGLGMSSGRSEAKDHCGGLRGRTGRAGEDGEGMGEGLSYRTSCHVQLNCPGTI